MSSSSTPDGIRSTFFYGTLLVLVVNSVAHFYTVAHITALTALKQIDPEFESVSASLKVPVWRTFRRVTVPICMPAILDIAVYMFVNALTTVSAVIFLYGPTTKLASVAIVHMDEMGVSAAAAGMATMIVLTALAAKLLQSSSTACCSCGCRPGAAADGDAVGEDRRPGPVRKRHQSVARAPRLGRPQSRRRGAARMLAEDARYFLHQSVSTPCLNAIVKAEGIYLEDTAGRRVMDFHGNNVHHIGYGHPRLKRAIAEQMDALPFTPRRYTAEPAIALARKLADNN